VAQAPFLVQGTPKASIGQTGRMHDNSLFLADIAGAVDRILSCGEGEVSEDWQTEPLT
jgi:hypothetical protein